MQPVLPARVSGWQTVNDGFGSCHEGAEKLAKACPDDFVNVLNRFNNNQEVNQTAIHS